MSVSEESQWTPTEQSNVCPKCGAPSESGERPRPGVTPGVATCDACGASLSQSPGTSGSENMSPPPQPVRRGGGRNPLALVVVAIVAAGMLYFGFHVAHRSTPARAVKSSEAPDFTLQSLDGKSMSLSDFRGKAVLLNFWATWCSPCKIEMPWFVEFQNQYGSQGLQIVGVAMDDSSEEDIAKFAKDMGVNYPVLLGKEAVGEEYGGVPALPESFFIGRNGRIVDKIIGLEGKGEIEEAIKKALNTQPGANAPAAAPVALAQPQR